MAQTNYRPNTPTHVIVGAVIIIIGMIMLLRNFNIIPEWFHEFFFRWQFILIAIGLISLITNHNKVPGLILILIGVFFLAPHYFKEFRNYFIPLAIILVGLAILLKRRRHYGTSYEPSDVEISDSDVIDITAVFSGSERQVTTRNFRGGKITTVFGGCEVNFLNADFDSPEVVIEVSAVFGGVSLIIPSNWEVLIAVNHIFGGFADKRYLPADHKFDPLKKIILKGDVVFGGGEIKSMK